MNKGWLVGTAFSEVQESLWAAASGQGPRQGQVLGNVVGHLLVGEDACDATISGSEHGQQAVPGGGGEVGSQACLQLERAGPLGPSQPPAPIAWCIRVEILIPPHTFHQLLCDACVQDQVMQKEVVAWNRRIGVEGNLLAAPCPPLPLLPRLH